MSHEGKAVSEGLVSIILFHLTTAAVEEKVFIMFLATKNKQFLLLLLFACLFVICFVLFF